MKSLVLGTGGICSAIVMALARKEGEAIALFIDHGQDNLAQDRNAFLALCTYFDIDAHSESLRAPKAWLPFKLTLFISYALVRAQELGCGIVYYGASQDDLLIESSETYLSTFRLLARRIQEEEEESIIDAEAPLALLDIKRIIHIGADPTYKVPWELTYSCEKGGEKHCGECTHCKRRRAGFAACRIKDLTKYTRIRK